MSVHPGLEEFQIVRVGKERSRKPSSSHRNKRVELYLFSRFWGSAFCKILICVHFVLEVLVIRCQRGELKFSDVVIFKYTAKN